MEKDMAILVQKFGGTSVADAEKIRRAAEKVIKAVKKGFSVVVVVSARGHQTDELIADALELNPNPPERELDQLLSTGEIQSVSLFAMALVAAGYEAISFTGQQIRLMTDSVHTKARIKSIDAQKIHNELKKGRVVLVAGFQGIDENGNITTLGRGGSDTTAVALAAVLGAQECEIYTDVDGVYTTDPRIFEKAVRLEKISYDEMLEMASMGAGVMHSRSIEFGKKYNVKIHVRHSGKDTEGTLITEESEMEDIVVSGATIQKEMAKVTLVNVDNKPGNAAKLFSKLAQFKVLVNDIIQTEVSPEKANMSFTTGISDLKAAKKAVEEVKKELNCDEIFTRDDIAEISVIGVGMRSHYGIADKMFSSLAQAKVNIDSITTSEIRISCVVDKTEGEKALKAVCEAFELDKPAGKRKKYPEKKPATKQPKGR
jgi:aspartate kinase